MSDTVDIFAATAPPIVAPTHSGFKLRDYQEEAVAASVKSLAGKRHGLAVLPTGSGKSVVIAGIVKETGAPTLVLQPSQEILWQNVGKFRAYGGRCGIYSASAGVKRMDDVTFATIGSVINKMTLLERFQHLVIDECHLVNAKSGGSMYTTLINSLPLSVIGLTATPYRLDKVFHADGSQQAMLKFLTRTKPRIFSDIVYYVQNRRLFDDGHLAKLVYYQYDVIKRNQLQRNSTGADFTDRSVQEQYRLNQFGDKLVKVVNRCFAVGRRNCLVFTRFVHEAHALSMAIPGCAVVSADTKDAERERIISGFKAGNIRCIANVGILTTGFDYPELDTVIMARPTMSLALYYQMIGRCIRPHPNKSEAWVIDMGGNFAQFGKVEDLELCEEGGWHVRSNGIQLTNVPFGDRFRARR